MISNTRQSLESKQEIPKNIHFIWIGGELPEKYFRELQQLAMVANENGFKVNFWVDNTKNITKTIERIFKDTIFLPKNNKLFGFKIRNINEIIDRLKNSTDLFTTKQQYLKFVEYIYRETIGNKNLAAASDLLRYAILYFEGGYYSDTDNQFSLKKMGSLFSKKGMPKLSTETRFLGFGSNMMVRYWDWKVGKPIDKTSIELWGNNDLISAIPKHEILKNAILKCIDNYAELDNQELFNKTKDISLDFKIDKKSTLMDLKRYPNSRMGYSRANPFGRMYMTIQSSGPGLFISAIQQYIIDHQIQSEDGMTLNLEGQHFYDQFKFAGIETTSSVCDLNWLKNINKNTCYDTNSLPNQKYQASEGITLKSSGINTSIELERTIWDELKDGNIKIIESMLESKVNPNQTDHSATTLLLMAVNQGRSDIVKLLLDKKANVNLANTTNGMTPLILAVRLGYPSIIDLLLNENKINVNQTLNESDSVIHEAINANKIQSLKVLLKSGQFNHVLSDTSQHSPLILAIKCENYAMTKELIDSKQVHVNFKNPINPIQPILSAVSTGNLSLVELLVAAKADVSAVDQNGASALVLALAGEHMSVVYYLLNENVINVNQNTILGDSPLIYAARLGHLKICRILLEKKADINQENQLSGSPLHMAVKNNYYAIVKELLESKADLSLNSKSFPSSLEVAVEKGYLPIVKLLNSYDAPVCDKNPSHPEISKALKVCCSYEAKTGEQLRAHYNAFNELNSQIQQLLQKTSYIYLGNPQGLQRFHEQIYQLYDEYIAYPDAEAILVKLKSIKATFEKTIKMETLYLNTHSIRFPPQGNKRTLEDLSVTMNKCKQFKSR